MTDDAADDEDIRHQRQCDPGEIAHAVWHQRNNREQQEKMRRIIDRVIALKVTTERGDACGLVRDHVIDRHGLTIEDHPSRRPKAEEVGRDVQAVCAQ